MSGGIAGKNRSWSTNAATKATSSSGWGSLPAEELVRRCWEGALRGGYVGHGETYLNEREELWWSKGGELVGASPARIGFLRHITEACPGGVLEPIEQAPFADAVVGGIRGEHEVHYLGFNQPRFRMFHMPAESTVPR